MDSGTGSRPKRNRAAPARFIEAQEAEVVCAQCARAADLASSPRAHLLSPAGQHHDRLQRPPNDSHSTRLRAEGSGGGRRERAANDPSRRRRGGVPAARSWIQTPKSCTSYVTMCREVERPRSGASGSRVSSARPSGSSASDRPTRCVAPAPRRPAQLAHWNCSGPRRPRRR